MHTYKYTHHTGTHIKHTHKQKHIHMYVSLILIYIWIKFCMFPVACWRTREDWPSKLRCYKVINRSSKPQDEHNDTVTEVQKGKSRISDMKSGILKRFKLNGNLKTAAADEEGIVWFKLNSVDITTSRALSNSFVNGYVALAIMKISIVMCKIVKK